KTPPTSLPPPRRLYLVIPLSTSTKTTNKPEEDLVIPPQVSTTADVIVSQIYDAALRRVFSEDAQLAAVTRNRKPSNANTTSNSAEDANTHPLVAVATTTAEDDKVERQEPDAEEQLSPEDLETLAELE
ncbi:unnamed protein product, partial [Amoebophrya sp. A120]